MDSSLDTESVMSGDATGMQPRSNMSNVSAQPAQNIRQQRRLEWARLFKRNKRQEKIMNREHRKLVRSVEQFSARLTDCQPTENTRRRLTKRQQRRLKNKRKRKVIEIKRRKLISRMQEFDARFPICQPSQQRVERALLLKLSKRKVKIMQTEQRKQNRRVLEISSRLTVCQRVPLFFGDSGYSKPVAEIAKGLIGQYLISRESNFVMRILETEAYLECEPLYHARFKGAPTFKIPAGTLLPWSSVGFFEQPVLVLTTGEYNSGDSNSAGDVVLLRSCEIIRGNGEIKSRRAHLLLGPEKVAKALHPELTENCNVLDATKGIHLYQEKSAGKIIVQGKRVLPRDTYVETYSELSELPGAEKEYRFALSSRGMKYEGKSQLHPSKRQDLATFMYRLLRDKSRASVVAA